MENVIITFLFKCMTISGLHLSCLILYASNCILTTEKNISDVFEDNTKSGESSDDMNNEYCA